MNKELLNRFLEDHTNEITKTLEIKVKNRLLIIEPNKTKRQEIAKAVIRVYILRESKKIANEFKKEEQKPTLEIKPTNLIFNR